MGRYRYQYGYHSDVNSRSLAAALSAVMTGFALLSSIVARDPWLSTRLAEDAGLVSLLGVASAMIALVSTVIAGPRAAAANLLFIIAVGAATTIGQGALGGLLNGYYSVYSSILSSLRFLGIPFYLAIAYAGLVPILAVASALATPKKSLASRRRATASAYKTTYPPRRHQPVRASSHSLPPKPLCQHSIKASSVPSPARSPPKTARLEARECPRLSEWGKS